MKSILIRRVERLEAESGGEDDLDRARRIVRACDAVEYHPERPTEEDRALAASTTKDAYMDALVLCWRQPGAFVAAVQASIEQREAKARALAEGKLMEGGVKEVEG
jgi:hypothetical protein